MTEIFFGILHGWSIASPKDGHAMWWLQLLAMAWLVARLTQTPSITFAFWRTARFALAWFASSMWWLYTAMHDFGGLPVPLAVFAVLALCGVLASFYALAAALFVALKPPVSYRPIQNALLFAALWLLAELLRGTVMTGLPWAAVGYAHIDGPLVSAAPWVGVYGVSALAAFVVALFVLTRSCALKIGVVLILCVKAALMPASPPQASTPALTVRLLQGNIPQLEKFGGIAGINAALDWYKTELARAAMEGIDLVVTPETGVPLLPQQLPSEYWPALEALFAGGSQTAALIGSPQGSMQEGYTNSIIGIGTKKAAPYRYDKHHLVPFGEFVPPLFRWFTELMHIPLGDFNRGDAVQPSFAHAGERFAPHICYENLFGEELALRFADAATAPTIFVNVSDLGWFGNSIVLDQDLSLSRMRAIEFNRPVLRATNTGITAIIDHQGFVTAQLPHPKRAALTGVVRGQTQLTPYAQWASRFGLSPLWCAGLLSVLWVWMSRIKKIYKNSDK